MILPRLGLRRRFRPSQDEETSVTLTAAALQERYLDDIFRYVARRVARREDAEDITAECFAAAFAALPGFRGQCDVRLWLLGIARRKVADALRRTARRREVLDSEADALHHCPSENGSPEAALAAQESARELRRMIRSLKEPQREALLLHYVEGLPQSEVAVVMGRSPAAINSLLQRARAALLRAGRGYFLDDSDDEASK